MNRKIDVTVAGKGRTLHINNRNSLDSLRFAKNLCRESICSFSRLTDKNTYIVGEEKRISVTKLAGEFHRYGNLRVLLNEISNDKPSMPGRTACNNVKSLRIQRLY